MKKEGHPKYFETTYECACGNKITTRSTVKNVKVEICSACHPFFTGKGDRVIDSSGMVEKFKKKYEKFDSGKK